jgi:hypothetical protein
LECNDVERHAFFFQEVPLLFSDNFDCQTVDEFIKGTLENDLTDHTIYVHAIENESYAARCHFFFCGPPQVLLNG